MEMVGRGGARAARSSRQGPWFPPRSPPLSGGHGSSHQPRAQSSRSCATLVVKNSVTIQPWECTVGPRRDRIQWSLLCRCSDRCLGRTRSEEHTSELQSHLKLVCRLLLAKKKVLQILNIHNID